MSKKNQNTAAQPEITTASIDKIAAKKAVVFGTTKKKSYLPMLIVGVGLLFVVGVGAYYVVYGPPNASGGKQAMPEHSGALAATLVTYPTSLFLDGVAKYFSYQHGDLTIKYFIVRSSDGVIRAAFDACDVCWPAGKGYQQDGDYMVCRNCGRRFESAQVNQVQGGCNPSPLIRAIQNDEVLIQVEDILKGQPYFDFSQHREV